MYYNVDYSICALAFLLIVLVRFFTTRQFPNKPNTLFGLALIFAALDILLDIVGAYMYDYVTALPLWSTYLVNTVFYFFQTAFPALMALYVLILTGNFERKNAPYICLLMVPAAFVAVSLLTNVWTRGIFYVDPVQGYVHMPLFYCLYLSTGFYAAVCLFLVNKYKKRLRRLQYWMITAFILIVLAAVLMQFKLPQLLLTGPAIALSMTMMYLVIQKPEDMLDTLTGAFDRGALMAYLGDVIGEKRYYDLIHIKVNNMRSIDRLLGTLRGNQVLVQVVEFLTSGLSIGWVFRMGSVRFVLINHNREAHKEAVERIRRRFEQPWEVDGYRVMLSVTVCDVPDTSSIGSVENMVGMLETVTMDIPRGETLVVDDDILNKFNRRETVEAAIHDALEQDSFEIYFQPVYSVKEGAFITAEALLRLPHEGGFISPDEFIPIAEHNGVIVQIDELVMRKVCGFFKDHDPVNTLGMVSAEINLSAVEFVYEGLPDRINAIIDESGVPPRCLLFEITETAATTDYQLLQSSMGALTERGFRFVLDDFGTGFANFNQVVRLPFFAAKLDRSMLVASGEDGGGDIVYKSSLNMFQSLGLKTVAEGVETAAQAGNMAELGVDYIQGFHYARPMPIPEFVEFLKAHNKK